MHGERLDRVRAAARVEPARRRQQRRDHLAVDVHRTEQHPGERARAPSGGAEPVVLLLVRSHQLEPVAGTSGAMTRSLRSAASRSAPSSRLDASAAGGRARTTTSVPAGNAGKRSRIKCRSRRVTRCRITAVPTALLTTKPTRVVISDFRVGAVFASASGKASPVLCGPRSRAWSARNTWTTNRDRPARRPRRTTRRNSWFLVSRAAAGSTAGRDQAVSCARPRRRREATMARPARVRMRSRNPCFLARRRLFGWKVRLPLLTVGSPGYYRHRWPR